MFEETRKIRYSHFSHNKTVRCAELLRFVQDAAVMHTTNCGYSLETLAEENSAWILLSIHLVLEKTNFSCEEIIVKTWPYDFSKVFGPRAFLICDSKTNSVLAKGSALWTYVNTSTGRPKEIPIDMIQSFGDTDLTTDVPYIRRLPVCETCNHLADYKVLKRDLDTNGHMNNVRYLEYAEEALPDDFIIKEIEIFYKQPLFLGDVLSLHTITESDGTIVVNLKKSDGEISTYIEFIPEKTKEV